MTSHRTTDHDVIRGWAETRGGKPAAVKATQETDDPGLLRIRFEDGETQDLQEIGWPEFFEKFDAANLAFLYQDRTKEGETSRFFKFVRRTE